ncbi:MAG: hypothetical protein KDD78_02485 [Caldilineaceae bacterium]|nr:hypothetical protein [Caldilineaceae bacterium]
MTFHTARFTTQPGEFKTGRHDHTVFMDAGIVVAGYTRHNFTDRGRIIYDTGFRAINTHEIQVTALTVTLGAILRNLSRVILIPMDKCFGFRISVTGAHPIKQERDFDIGTICRCITFLIQRFARHNLSR